ncbi:hypothetical protein FBQ82_01525 [Anaerolineae bacterium CFX7]|mgnify:CR=1 FL=1|nr:hypothetical protein [Anaerolineae bacterium CFX7]
MDSLFDSVCSSSGICDALGVWLSALLTILVFTYLVRDSFLFRLASGLLVGTAVGFASAVILGNVLLPLLSRLLDQVLGLPDTWAELLLSVLPIVLGVSLLLRLTPTFRTSTFSNIGLAYLFGIGAALTIGGALAGNLVPQLVATMTIPLVPQDSLLEWANGIIILIGVIGSFLAFRFIQPGNRSWQRAYAAITHVWGTIGRGFIMIAFGAILASLILARVSVLVSQLYFLLHDWLPLLK